jgi:hypothetical protein
MADKPQDDARDVHDEPDKGDSESPEETMARHEELHREHRSRIDRLMTHCGIKEEGMPEDDVTGGKDKPDRSDSVRSRRRRHD